MPYSEPFLRAAIHLSKEKMEEGEGGPFGAVVVRNGKIIGRGWNRVTSINDPTAHAEVEAIRSACQNIESFTLEGCEIYASCEPCPMCLAAIYWARLDALYFAATRHNAADAGFDDAMLYGEMLKPMMERKLRAEQHLQGEAEHILNMWKAKPDKRPY